VDIAMSEAPQGFQADERRLAAILAADVVGYSRLMGRDEAATVRDLEAHKAVILPLIAKHGGSIVNIAGDGIVAQFPSAVRAVECAVAIQKIMAERNVDVPADRRMLLRIGVNLGDIIHDADKTYGDGINVAARLEPLAEPGGICISATVRDAIFGKLGLPLRDVGEKTLKNIDRPVHVYQIQSPGTRSRRHWLSAALRQYRRLAPALGLVLLIAAAAGIAAWRFWPRPATEFDFMPTVAVLPFVAAGNDPEQSDFARSLTHEASAYLSTAPYVHTLAIPESAAKLSPRELAQQSGAAYALDGDLAKVGEKTRVAVRLTDVGTGESLWSDHYDFEGSDRLAMQSEAARKIYGAIGGGWGKIDKAETERAWRKPDRDLTDYDYYLRARGYFPADTHESLARARQIAEEGLARFPSSPALNLAMAQAFLQEQVDLGPFADYHEKFALAWKYANQADKTKGRSRRLEFLHHELMAKLYNLYAGNFDRSIEEAEAAIEMGPNEARVRATLASFLSFAGRHDQAIEWASTALHQEHNAAFAQTFKPNLAWTLYAAGRYDEAFETIKGSETQAPDWAAVMYVRVGRIDEARAIIADWLKIEPITIATDSCWAMKEPLKSAWLDDLRKAGLPEK
jgi:class 3 adenylate cyclase/TolB-like protein